MKRLREPGRNETQWHDPSESKAAPRNGSGSLKESETVRSTAVGWAPELLSERLSWPSQSETRSATAKPATIILETVTEPGRSETGD